MSATLTLARSQLFVAWTQQDVGDAPLRLSSVLTWLHHIISAGLPSAPSWIQTRRPVHNPEEAIKWCTRSALAFMVSRGSHLLRLLPVRRFVIDQTPVWAETLETICEDLRSSAQLVCNQQSYHSQSWCEDYLKLLSCFHEIICIAVLCCDWPMGWLAWMSRCTSTQPCIIWICRISAHMTRQD